MMLPAFEYQIVNDQIDENSDWFNHCHELSIRFKVRLRISLLEFILISSEHKHSQNLQTACFRAFSPVGHIATSFLGSIC